MGDKGGGGSPPPPIFYQDPRTEIDDKLGKQLEEMTLLTESLMEMVQKQSQPPSISDPTGGDKNNPIVPLDDNEDVDTADTWEAAELDPEALPTYRPKSINWTDKIGDFNQASKGEVENMINKLKSGSTLVTTPLTDDKEPDVIKTLLGGH